MSLQAVVDRKVEKREAGDEEESLSLLGDSILVIIFYGFLVYRQLRSNGSIVCAIIMQFLRSESWAATVLTFLEYRDQRGRHRQKIVSGRFHK